MFKMKTCAVKIPLHSVCEGCARVRPKGTRPARPVEPFAYGPFDDHRESIRLGRATIPEIRTLRKEPLNSAPYLRGNSPR